MGNKIVNFRLNLNRRKSTSIVSNVHIELDKMCKNFSFNSLNRFGTKIIIKRKNLK